MFPSLSKPVSLIYTAERFKSLLDDAANNASSDWDRTFVDDMVTRYHIYGSGMHISALQRHHLERIATNLEPSNARKRNHRAA